MSSHCCAEKSHGSYHSHAKMFWKVFAVLMFLTLVTVLAAKVDFGVMNFVIAMLIASVKALFVALIFMHLKWEDPITWLYALFPVALLFLMLGLIFLDTPFRTDPTVAHSSAAIVVEHSSKVVEHH